MVKKTKSATVVSWSTMSRHDVGDALKMQEGINLGTRERHLKKFYRARKTVTGKRQTFELPFLDDSDESWFNFMTDAYEHFTDKKVLPSRGKRKTTGLSNDDLPPWKRSRRLAGVEVEHTDLDLASRELAQAATIESQRAEEEAYVKAMQDEEDQKRVFHERLNYYIAHVVKVFCANFLLNLFVTTIH